MKTTLKKGVMSELIGVFVLVLVIAVLAAMIFLFTGSIKAQAATQAPTSDSIFVKNETQTLVTTVGNATSAASLRNCYIISASITAADTGVVIRAADNYTLNSPSNCYVRSTAASAYRDALVNVSYTYTWTPYTTSEKAVNNTETAGVQIVNYLPILLLAVIFGIILAVVLKVILPYLNLGNQVTGF